MKIHENLERELAIAFDKIEVEDARDLIASKEAEGNSGNDPVAEESERIDDCINELYGKMVTAEFGESKADEELDDDDFAKSEIKTELLVIAFLTKLYKGWDLVVDNPDKAFEVEWEDLDTIMNICKHRLGLGFRVEEGGLKRNA